MCVRSIFLDHKLLGSKMRIKKDRRLSLCGLDCVSPVICFRVTVVNLMHLDSCVWKPLSLSVLTP